MWFNLSKTVSTAILHCLKFMVNIKNMQLLLAYSVPCFNVAWKQHSKCLKKNKLHFQSVLPSYRLYSWKDTFLYLFIHVVYSDHLFLSRLSTQECVISQLTSSGFSDRGLAFLLTLYWSLCRLPFKCISLALGSLKLHSQSLQWKRITFPSSFLTWKIRFNTFGLKNTTQKR